MKLVSRVVVSSSQHRRRTNRYTIMVIELVSVVAFGRIALGFRLAFIRGIPGRATRRPRALPGKRQNRSCVANAQHGPMGRRVPGRPDPGRGSPSAYICPRAFNQGTREVLVYMMIVRCTDCRYSDITLLTLQQIRHSSVPWRDNGETDRRSATLFFVETPGVVAKVLTRSKKGKAPSCRTA